MRVQDLSPEECAIFHDVIRQARVGYLGLIDSSGYPRVVPLHFVMIDDQIYFHGGSHGEKYTLLKTSPKVTFTADLQYALIPSDWIHPERGCAVTQFFKAILVRGHGRIVEHTSEKIQTLVALLEKYQPQANYLPLTTVDTVYSNALLKVVVYRIDIDTISVKINVGQRMSDEILNQIETKLHERGTDVDYATLLELQNYRKSH